MNLPVRLQWLNSADPGALPEWLVANMTEVGGGTMIPVFAAMNLTYLVGKCH